MKCLVTGASGFIGSNIVKELMKEGYQVKCLVRENSNLENLIGLDIEIVKGDIQNKESLLSAMNGCDFVFHAAALYTFWSRDKNDFYRTNVEGTKNVLDSALEKKIKRLVYTSTTATLGASKTNKPISESDSIEQEKKIDLWKVKDHYIRSKTIAEREVLKYSRDLDVVIVNPSAPLGWGDVKPTPTSLLVLKFLDGEVPFYTDVGLSFVYVKDVARGHILALKNGKSGERYILGGHNLSLTGFFKVLSEVTGLKKPAIRIPKKLLLVGIPFVGLLEFFSKITKKPPVITRSQLRSARYNFFYSSDKAKKELNYSISPLEIALNESVLFFLSDMKNKLRRKIVEKKIMEKETVDKLRRKSEND